MRRRFGNLLARCLENDLGAAAGVWRGPCGWVGRCHELDPAVTEAPLLVDVVTLGVLWSAYTEPSV